MDALGITGIVLSALGISGGGIIGFVRYLSLNKLTIKRINNFKDADVDSFIELYEKTINENNRISTDEIIDWIPKKRFEKLRQTLKHDLFICKFNNTVVGFLKTIYCSESRYMFIAYLGVDKHVMNNRKISLLLIKRLKRYINWRCSDCKAVFFEVQSSRNTIDPQESMERKARLKLFKDLIKKLNLTAFEIDVPYCQPEIPNEFYESTKEEELILLYAPFKKIILHRLSKAEVLKGLHFIFFKVYLPTYRNNSELHQLYKDYLTNIYTQYVKNLRPAVTLI